MTTVQAQSASPMDLLKALAAQLGVAVVPAAQASTQQRQPKPQQAQAAPKYKSTYFHRPQGAQQAQRRQWKPRAVNPNKPKAIYGTAPVGSMPIDTHQLRVAALEAAIPGISQVANIFSIGKNASGQLEKHLQLVVNSPFTYVDLPGGKTQMVGTLSPEEVRTRIKAAGYGFTIQTDPNGNRACFWGTDSKGHAVGRVPFPGFKKLNVAASMVAAD